MAKEKISIKFLIHLVGERPALWDKTSESYRDRSLKETSWREICTFITDHYEHMQPEQKQEFTKMVMKKWTHIRDSWVKSMKYGYDESTNTPIKPYVYHKELKFMQKILKCKPRRSDFSIPALDNSSYEKFYNDRDGSQNSIPCDDHGEEGEHDNEQQLEENDEKFKQENLPLDDSEHVVENQALVLEDYEDDWPLEDVNVKPIIDIKREPNHVMSNNSYKNDNRAPQQQPALPRGEVKKSISIFKHFSDNEEQTSSYAKRDKEPIRASGSFSTNNYLDENRHWSFFKGILPSVNTLDEDHTLQFQAGVITLLQKLRSSQNSQNFTPRPMKSSAKKRKPNDDDDYEWPIHKVDLPKHYSTRGSRSNADPIGGEDLQFESENSY